MIRGLVCELGVQRALFRNTLERLLVGFVNDDIELAILLNDPGGVAWKDDDLDRSLNLRLRDTFGVYMTSVQGMATLLCDLSDRIGLSECGKVSFLRQDLFNKKLTLIARQPTWYDAKSHKKAWKKFMACLSKKEHDLMLQKMHKANKNLMDLTKDSLDLEPSKAIRRRVQEPYQTIREYAGTLHNILECSWSCTCLNPHSAELRLEMRPSQATPSFHVRLPFEGGLVPGRPKLPMMMELAIRPLTLRDFQAEKRETNDITLDTSIGESSPGTAASVVQIGIMSTAMQLGTLGAPSPKHSTTCSDGPNYAKNNAPWAVRAQQKLNTSRHEQIIATVDSKDPSTDSPSTGIVPHSITNKITNLCHTLVQGLQGQQDEVYLGCLADDKSMLGVYVPPQQKTPPPKHITTLYKVLTRDSGMTLSDPPHARSNKTENFAPTLSKKSRLRLAVILASTALQLHNTPWIHKKWGKQDIRFHNGDVDHPHISKTFTKDAIEVKDVTKPSWTPIRNDSIFNLGVLLLELSYGKSLDSFRTHEDPPIFTEYAIASRLVTGLSEEESSGYVDAARACIFCDFGTKIKISSLDNEAFRQAVYEDVVAPLEDDWNHWNRRAT